MTRAGILVFCGFVAVLFGAAVLNGCLCFLLHPEHFQREYSVSWSVYLAVGLFASVGGSALIVLNTCRASDVLKLGIMGTIGGVVLALPAVIQAGGHALALQGLLIFSIFWVLAAGMKAVVPVHKQNTSETPKAE